MKPSRTTSTQNVRDMAQYGIVTTPETVARVLVDLLQPTHGSIYDPCCGAGGLLLETLQFLARRQDPPTQFRFYGQEKNQTVWRLAQLRLARRDIEGDIGSHPADTVWRLAHLRPAMPGIEADLGPHPADTFHQDLHPGLEADYILANPPSNVSDWGAERFPDDPRWQYGQPPADNANFAWLQHIISHLAPSGAAAVLMPFGTLISNSPSEIAIRRAILEADLVDCIVALPGRLLPTTPMRTCVWLLTRDKRRQVDLHLRDRCGETLFIDAYHLGEYDAGGLTTLRDASISRIVATYKAWRRISGTADAGNQPGFSRATTIDDIRRWEYMLSPRLYVEDTSSDVSALSVLETLEASSTPAAGTENDERPEKTGTPEAS